MWDPLTRHSCIIILPVSRVNNLAVLLQTKFTKANEKLIKKFGMMHKYEDSQEFLLEHPHLTCEEAANFLVIWCINLEMEEVCITYWSLGSVSHIDLFDLYRIDLLGLYHVLISLICIVLISWVCITYWSLWSVSYWSLGSVSRIDLFGLYHVLISLVCITYWSLWSVSCIDHFELSLQCKESTRLKLSSGCM